MSTETENGEQDRVADYMRPNDWCEARGATMFPTAAALQWFIRQHKEELVRRRAYLPRTGRSGSLVHAERLDQAVVEILQREAGAAA